MPHTTSMDGEAITPSFTQRYSAANDVNGNPRRAVAVYGLDRIGNPRILDAYDEGYGDKPVWLRELHLPELPTISVTAGEYKEWLHRAENINGRFEVVEPASVLYRAENGESVEVPRDEFVWHRFGTRARALKYRREHHKAPVLFIRDRRGY